MIGSKTLVFAATALLAPTIANAGVFDLTGQPIDIIFEEGNYIEGRVGIVTPDQEGSNPVLGDFGDIGNTIPFFTLGAKTDFTDRISGAILYDTPFLRDTTYSSGIFEGTDARVEAQTLTAVGRFKLNENFSVYGGPRLQMSSIDLQGPFARFPAAPGAVGAIIPGEVPTYQMDVRESDFGYVVGAAAEVPELKARIAVTYNSQINHTFDSEETFAFQAPAFGDFGVTIPQSLNAEFQFPVTTSTLVRANVRWVDWSSVDFTPPAFLAVTGDPVVVYTDDVVTYRLTVAQRLNENLAAFVTGSYEEQGDEEISLFKTVDGGFSIGGGFIIENGKGLKLTIGGEYSQQKGLSGVQSPTLPVPSELDDADTFAFSAKFGYSF